MIFAWRQATSKKCVPRGEEKQNFLAGNCKDKAAQSLAPSPKQKAEIAKKAASARWNANPSPGVS
jgi:hypothetical protein